MGLMLWKQGDAEEAGRLFQEVVRLEPRFVSGWNNLAALMASQGHMEKAWSCLSEALRLKPDHVSALNNKKAWMTLKND
jgi:Flp pilus assembly protein TadD